MKARPLEKLASNWQDHKSALWWLGLLYRRPTEFNGALLSAGPAGTIVTSTLLNDQTAANSRQRLKQRLIRLDLWTHSLPYLLLIGGIRHLIISDDPVQPWTWAWPIAISEICLALLVTMLAGWAVGPSGQFAPIILFPMATVATFGMRPDDIVFGIIWGIAWGIFLGITADLERRSTLGPAIAIFVLYVFAMGVIVLPGSAASWSVPISVGAITCEVTFLRLYYYPLHLLIMLVKHPMRFYRFHPVAWDDFCPVAFIGLDRILIRYAAEDLPATKKEIERLIVACPSQRMLVLRALIILLARESAQVVDLSRLEDILVRIPGGDSGFLYEAVQIQQGMNEISRLQTRLNTVDRPIFRELNAQLLVSKIENFQSRIAGFREPTAGAFRTASESWKRVALKQLKEARTIRAQKPIHQVFRAGDPIDRDSEAFVLRSAVSGSLEQQIMLSTGCPGLLLYGRRRMGKSTVLHNLEGFLPGNVLCVAMSMQNPLMFASVQHFAEHLVDQINSATKSTGGARDLVSLYAFLEETNKTLRVDGNRLLIALDEYEIIDRKIKEQVFSRDLLDVLHESMQMHRRIIWLLAGSHEMTELRNAPWASYFLSIRTIEVPGFTSDETRLLLTEPLKYSNLWRQSQTRPGFDVGFWGQGGIERIHAEAGGWPVFVQLIAETAIDILNEEGKRAVTTDVLDRSLQRCIVKGDTVLSQLLKGESTLAEEWEYLLSFREKETQPPPSHDAVLTSLRRRQLIVTDNGSLRLRAPLMRLWLRHRA